MRFRCLAIVLLLLALCCSPESGAANHGAPGTPAATRKKQLAGSSSSASSHRLPLAPEGALDLKQAREYGLSLINRDRARKRLRPVDLDDVACKAAQWHSGEMAKYRYNNHWSPEGMKPPQRYAMSGGFDYVSENCLGAADTGGISSSIIAPEQKFTRAELEQIEASYINEKPPQDQDRKNILDPRHTHVGLGYTLYYRQDPTSGKFHRKVASAQEFINRYGSFRASDYKLTRGIPFVLTAKLQPPLRVRNIQVYWEPHPRVIPVKDLRASKKYSSCALPAKKLLAILPPPAQSPRGAVLDTSGQSFRLALTADKQWKDGLYYIIVRASANRSGKSSFPVALKVVPLFTRQPGQ